VDASGKRKKVTTMSAMALHWRQKAPALATTFKESRYASIMLQIQCGTQSHVRDDKANTRAPLMTPSFIVSHLPNRCSCPMPATSSICETPSFRPFTVPFACTLLLLKLFVIHGAVWKNSFGGDSSCKEFTTPGAGIAPTWENDLSFESSFHIRMSPSHDPLMRMNQGLERDKHRRHSPETTISEYRRLASAVTQRGVLIMPSVSECTSLKPWAKGCVNIGFFRCVVHKHIELY
jgi:hypothetical protein